MKLNIDPIYWEYIKQKLAHRRRKIQAKLDWAAAHPRHIVADLFIGSLVTMVISGIVGVIYASNRDWHDMPVGHTNDLFYLNPSLDIAIWSLKMTGFLFFIMILFLIKDRVMKIVEREKADIEYLREYGKLKADLTSEERKELEDREHRLAVEEHQGKTVWTADHLKKRK